MRIFYKECKSLVRAGFEVKLIVVEQTRSTCTHYTKEIRDGIEVVIIPCKYSSKLQRMWKAGKLAYRHALKVNAALYFFHDPEFLWFGYLLFKKGKKVIYDVHEDVPRQILAKSWIPSLFRKPVAFLFEKAELFFASFLSGIITATTPIARRFEGIHNNVAAVKNYPVLSLLPEPYDYDLKKNQACYIGDITRARGIVEMVRSLEGIDIQLALAGRFSEPDLRKEVMQLTGWKQVIEYGYVERQKASLILKESKIGLVLLHPVINYQDALPVKLFEFMAAGIPVVVSNLRMQQEIVTKANCGIIVNPFDIEAIKKALQFLLQHPAEARQMGINGRHAVEKNYNWEDEEKKLISFCSKIISK
jgi:glycosyltransferase involved in cell wall biosynthesis